MGSNCRCRSNNYITTPRKCVVCALLILCPKWRVVSKDIETYLEGACVIVKRVDVPHNLMIDGDIDDDHLAHYTAMHRLTVS